MRSDSRVIEQGTTYYVDPLKGDYRMATPGVTAVKYVFREITLNTTDRSARPIDGLVQVEGITDWEESPLTWTATRDANVRFHGRVGETTVTTTGHVVEYNKTVFIDSAGVVAHVSSPGTTAVNFVFDVGAEAPIVFEKRLNGYRPSDRHRHLRRRGADHQ